ncbi:hypothetical protein SEVIR_1G074050v4 [Setaria viridis]
MEHPRARCDGCGGNLEPWGEAPVIFDCFHALHAACASGSDACPCCRTPRTRPAATPEAEAGAGGAASSSPPDSSVAGDMRSNGDPSASVGEDPPVIQCDVCGGLFRPTETGFWRDQCPHSILRGMNRGRVELRRAPGSPTWSWSSFGSPERSPSPSDIDEFGQPPAATAIPTAPSRYSDTVPFGQPPPAPAHPFQPQQQQPPAQFAPPPSMYQQYPHPDLFGPPPYFYRPLPPPHYHFQTSTFEYQQQPPPPAPACFAYAPAAAVSPSCAACGGAVVRGQTAVTSQCNHTFHFRCFAGSVHACPACGAQWSDVGPAIPPPSIDTDRAGGAAPPMSL